MNAGLRSWRVGSALRVIAALLCMGALTASGQVAYTATASGDWSDAGIWSPGGGPPLAADTARIGAGITVTLDAAAAGSVAALTVTGGGGKLTLATNLTVSGAVLIDLGAAVDLGGQTLSAANMTMDDGGTAVNRTGGGVLQVSGTLSVREDADLTLGPSDAVGSVAVVVNENATRGNTSLTTASTGNISGSISVGSGTPLNSETLHLGADLVTTGNINLNAAYADGGTIQMHGHSITANAIWIYMSSPITDRATGGRITINSYTGVRGAVLACRQDDLIRDGIYLNVQYQAGANVVVDQGSGDLRGLTLGYPGKPNAAFNMNDGSKGASRMTLTFDAVEVPGAADWAFRWYGDHASTLRTWQANGHLVVNTAALFDPAVNIWYADANAGGDGYTYVGYPARFPETGAVLSVR